MPHLLGGPGDGARRVAFIMKPQPGGMAPDFTAEVVEKGCHLVSNITLSALRGERVVLVFYPKDNTPGCTIQACAMRDQWDDLRGRARIFGVSTDSAASHRKFVDKHDLPYPLIADPDRKIVDAYGVWVEKSMMGKRFMGTERTTFVIDPEGRIEAVLEKVSPARHLDLLREALA